VKSAVFLPNPPANQKLIRWAAFSFIAGCLGMIVIADCGKGPQCWGFLNVIPYSDKIGHLFLIGTLTLLCHPAFPPRHQRRYLWLFTRTSLIILTVISLEEPAQAFIPSRTCDLGDWLADLAGLLAGQTMALCFFPAAARFRK
jgi:hypothetical protein